MTGPLKNDWDDTGRVLLKRGKRKSRGNDPSAHAESIKHLLAMMEINRQDRSKPKSRKEKLRGLFGSDED